MTQNTISAIPYSPKTRRKPVALTVQLRVPYNMLVAAVAREVRDAIERDPRFIVYRNRVEVFAP